MNLKSLKLKLAVLAVSAFFAVSCEQEKIEPAASTQNNESFISEETAVKLAENILFKPDPSAKNQSVGKKNITSVKTIKESGSTNLFYIINYENGGFVIVAGDNRLSPILAFSDNSVFRTDGKDYSSGLVGWLKTTSDTIKKLRKSDLEQSGTLKKEWSSFSKSRMITVENMTGNSTVAKPIEPYNPNNCVEEYESVGPLLKTKWQQGCGFNEQLPIMDCTGNCNRAYAGCVPIAIAQVMKYHASPSSYNWGAMPSDYGTASTAGLIKDIHTKIGSVSYSCTSTGVSSSYNLATVFTGFGYSSASQGTYNHDVVKQQLRIKKPVILTGGTTENFLMFSWRGEGHAWVCDGFMASKYCIFDEKGNYVSSGGILYLSMNWGWGGYEDGWYAYNNFSAGGSSFNFKPKMTYNITP